MKQIPLFLVCLLFSLTGIAQSSDDMMKNWMAYMTPGDMQKHLSKSDGKWKAEIRMWMDPSQPPEVHVAECEQQMILGGRYQVAHFKGNFNGMPFEGMSTTGYDNTLKKFVSSWVDNLGTGMTYMEGNMDASGKQIVFKGKQTDPMSGQAIDVEQTYRYVSDKEEFLEMFMIQNGKKVKMMEMKMTRV